MRKLDSGEAKMNKAMVATLIREVLEDMVKTPITKLTIENKSGEELFFEYEKLSTGLYSIKIFPKDFNSVCQDKILTRLTSLELNISISV